MESKPEYDYYDGDETDERLKVELLELSPYFPEGGHFFDGIHFDERGLVFLFCDGSNQKPKTYEMQVVFSGGFQNFRTQALSVFEDNKLFFFQEKSGADKVKFWAFRCRYTNYFNWCIRQSLDREYLEKNGWHYVLAAQDMWVDVFSVKPPRVFVNVWGMNLPGEESQQIPASDVLYNYCRNPEKWER